MQQRGITVHYCVTLQHHCSYGTVYNCIITVAINLVRSLGEWMAQIACSRYLAVAVATAGDLRRRG